MKSVVIYSNCQADQSMYYMRKSVKFCQLYTVTNININYYLHSRDGQQTSPVPTQLFVEDEKKIKSADILICQFIKTDRGFLNHKNIISLLKPGCRVFMVPHYRFHGYHYGMVRQDIIMNILSIAQTEVDATVSIEKIKDYIDNHALVAEQTLIESYWDQQIKDFKLMEDIEASPIKMYDVMLSFGKSNRLFNNPLYPNTFFFYHWVRRFLIYLGITDLTPYEILPKNHPLNWYHTMMPILPAISKSLGLKFDYDDIRFYGKFLHYTPVNSIYEFIYYWYPELFKNLNLDVSKQREVLKDSK